MKCTGQTNPRSGKAGNVRDGFPPQHSHEGRVGHRVQRAVGREQEQPRRQAHWFASPVNRGRVGEQILQAALPVRNAALRAASTALFLYLKQLGAGKALAVLSDAWATTST
jgi:hypothetical protein